MGQIDRKKQQSEQPPKEKRADKPQWLEVLKPHRYAKPWYDKTKFAQRCVKSFKAVNEDQPLHYRMHYWRLQSRYWLKAVKQSNRAF